MAELIHWENVSGPHRTQISTQRPTYGTSDSVTCDTCNDFRTEQQRKYEEAQAIPFDWEALEMLPFTQQLKIVKQQVRQSPLFRHKEEFIPWTVRHFDEWKGLVEDES